MKKIILTILFVLNTSLAHAFLPVGGYFGVRGGTSIQDNVKLKPDFNLETKNSPFASINAGVRFFRFRGELEYLYKYNIQEISFSSINKDLSTTTTMANLYYNFIELPFIRFYVNGGLGYTSFSTNFVQNNGDFTYNVGFGGTFTLANAISIDAGYRYLNMGEVEIFNKKNKLHSNDIYLGLRFGF